MALSFGSAARADVSSWFFAGGGGSLLNHAGSNKLGLAMEFDAGLGSSPRGVVAVGGLGRLHTRFGDGTELGLGPRLSTRGYNQGDWGAALDAGYFRRFWDASASGVQGTLSLGAPWGITLNLEVGHDSLDRNLMAAVIGLDFARFTVYRRTGTAWFVNPFPSPSSGAR